MDQSEMNIIKLAKEAGAVIDRINHNTAFTLQELERFAALVRAEALEEAAELMLVLDLCGEEGKAAAAIRGLK